MGGFTLRRSLPVERPDRPLLGHKLAYPMLSADGRAAAFKGIWSSAQPVYGLRDTAACFWKPSHHPPERRCGCGFYCFHSLAAAQEMACEGRYRSTVILDVEVSGRFIRHEHGLRYSDQRVLAVHLNRCPCGRPASVMVDSGDGITGWMQLQPCCPRCTGPKATTTLSEFRTLLGDAAPTEGEAWDSVADRVAEGTEAIDSQPATVSLLAAEVALLQARVDRLEAQVSRLS